MDKIHRIYNVCIVDDVHCSYTMYKVAHMLHMNVLPQSHHTLIITSVSLSRKRADLQRKSNSKIR